MTAQLPGNKILHLEMPAKLRGSRFENIARAFARKIKSKTAEIEKKLRRGKIRVKLPSINKEIWLDFDFATKIPIPKKDALLAAFVSELEPGNIVYDIGGFVGWYAIPAADIIGSKGRVFSFEPVPESAKWLRRHIELNRVENIVRVVESACGNEFGIVSMPVWPLGLASGNALLDVHPQSDIARYNTEVCLVPLDAFWKISQVSPDIIKIDVEGAEMWVLEGAREILEVAKPVILLEIHKFAWPLFGTSEKGLRDFLGSLSYEILEISIPNAPMTVLPDRGFAILKPTDPL